MYLFLPTCLSQSQLNFFLKLSFSQTLFLCLFIHSISDLTGFDSNTIFHWHDTRQLCCKELCCTVIISNFSANLGSETTKPTYSALYAKESRCPSSTEPYGQSNYLQKMWFHVDKQKRCKSDLCLMQFKESPTVHQVLIYGFHHWYYHSNTKLAS